MRRKTLAEEHPELVPQWGTSNELSPSDVSSGSHKKVWWTCEKGHSWEATIKNRALLGSGCPYCEHRAVLKGFNDLQTVNPNVARTWSPKNTLKPSEVSPSSNTKVLWICKNGHEWSARIADRNEGHGCPYCAGHRVWKGFNDLATTHPDLVSEWSDKNKDISPETITYKNRTNVWWHCSRCGNEYQAVVYTKAKGYICPFCIVSEIQRIRNKRRTESKIHKDFEYLLPQLAVIYYAGQHNLKVIPNSEGPVGIPVTAWIPRLSLIIDVCNNDKEKYAKDLICKINNIRYVCLTEKLSENNVICRIRKEFAVSHVYFTSQPDEDLDRIRESYVKWRNQ